MIHYYKRRIPFGIAMIETLIVAVIAIAIAGIGIATLAGCFSHEMLNSGGMNKIVGGIMGLGILGICFAAEWKPLKVVGSLFLYVIVLVLALPLGLMIFNLKVSTCVDLLLH